MGLQKIHTMNRYIFLPFILVVVLFSNLTNSECAGISVARSRWTRARFQAYFGKDNLDACYKNSDPGHEDKEYRNGSFITAKDCNVFHCSTGSHVGPLHVSLDRVCSWTPKNIHFNHKCVEIIGYPGEGEESISSEDRSTCFRQVFKCEIDDQGETLIRSKG